MKLAKGKREKKVENPSSRE